MHALSLEQVDGHNYRGWCCGEVLVLQPTDIISELPIESFENRGPEIQITLATKTMEYDRDECGEAECGPAIWQKCLVTVAVGLRTEVAPVSPKVPL